jgi:hypothetical protein
MRKQDEKEGQKPYTWVKDAKGIKFLCPADVIKDAAHVVDEELKDCINVDALKPYTDDI